MKTAQTKEHTQQKKGTQTERTNRTNVERLTEQQK